MKLKHWIAHLFGWNTGHAYSWHKDDILMMGFKCSHCDTISDVHKAPSSAIINAEIERCVRKTPRTLLAQPLSDEQICNLWSWAQTKAAERTANTQQHAFARAIERAHGINALQSSKAAK